MSTIAIYGRLRPSSKASDQIEVTEDQPNVVNITVNGETSAGREGRVQYKFRFSKRPGQWSTHRLQLFGPSSTQDEVFETVGRKICDRFTEGFNGTIFAYGQTGSGKTYTIEGGANKFADRGLIPRALTYIYDKLAERTDEKVSMQVTYLEIYNDVAYDLLNAASGANSRLPKVSVSDRANGCHIHGLSKHVAPNEDVAQSLLFLGRTNRTVAKTSMNLASSRSHSVFTITLTAQKEGSEVITVSKLHLVDLAGSERVAKSNARGKQLTEAKHINLSLHYLEAVIIALQSDGRTKKHVPYRNSLLTKLLRDSLGGNCLTAMIANVSQVTSNIPETISTCRFAQRVALVSNAAVRNEVLDDKTIIKRLRSRVAQLQAELVVAQQVGGKDEPESETDLDRNKLRRQMRSFCRGKLADPLTVATSAAAIRVCFELLRDMMKEQRHQIETLEDVAQEAERKDERLRDLQTKFGVTKAKMRNMESSRVVPSGYGSRRRTKSQGGVSTRSLSTSKSTGSLSSSRGRQRTKSEDRAQQTRDLVQQSQQKLAQKQESRRQATLNLAKTRLKQLHAAEIDCKRALEVVSERLRHQQDVLLYCEQRAPHRLLDEKYTERELEQERARLAKKLGEIKRVKEEMSLNQSMLQNTAMTRSKTEPTLSRAADPRRGSRQEGRAPLERRSSTLSQKSEHERKQQELATKEAATRQKLLMLKQQLRREGTNPSLSRSASTAWAPSTEPPASAPSSSNPTPTRRLSLISRLLKQPDQESDSSESEGDSSEDEIGFDRVPSAARVSPSKARPQNSEKTYMSAVEAQKSRISRIRETIRAVEVIQRAWRAYRQRKGTRRRY